MTDLVFTSTDDIRNYFISLKNDEDENNWSAGDALVAAVNQGYKLKPLYHEVLASVLQYSYSTINNQWRTATVFPEDKRALEKCWSVHKQAARAVKRITRVDDYKLAWDWLDRAIDDKLTTDALADVMAGKNADVHKGEPTYLCKRVPAHIHGCNIANGAEKAYLEIFINKEDAKGFEEHFVQWYGMGAPVLLTMFIPAQVDSVNSEAAAA